MKKQARQNAPEERNRFLMDEMQRLAHLGNWEFDLPANRLAWSAEVTRIFGLELQETGAAYEDFLAVVHPEDRAAVDAAYRASVQEKRDEFEIEHRIIQAGSGEIRYVHQKCLYERNRQGMIVRSTGIVQDITERKQAVEALRESEARFRLLAENSTDMISHHDAQGNYLYVSPACRTLLGYEPEDLIGHSAFDFIHPDDIQRVEQSRLGIIDQPVVSTIIFRGRCKNGEYIWLETTSRTILNQATGEVLGIHAASRDITERKRAEETLRESEERYRQAIVAAGAVPYYRDYQKETETYTFIGDGIRQLTGYPAAEITPAILDQMEQESIMRGTLAHLTSEEAGRLSEAGKIQHWACDYRILTRDGQTRWVADSAVQVRDEKNRRIGVIGILQDITERKRAEETLQWQARFQRLLMDISLTYINLPPADVSAAMNNSLAELGAFVGADRAYIFTYDFPAQICINTHEWCAEGITPQIDQLQAVPLEAVPDWVAAHTQGQPIYIPDVTALPAGSLKDILAPHEIQSLLTVPMMDSAACSGFIGFDSVRQIRYYSEDEQRLLRVFAELLVNIYRRQQAEEKLNETRANLQAIIENTLDNIWAINTNYEILYTDEVFARAFQATFGILLVPGISILNSLPTALRPTWKERYDRAFNGERFVFVDAIDLGNTTIHVEVAVNPIVHSGKVVGASFFGRDVTARKQGEQALEVALAKYKTLFETFPLGISVTDETGRILEANATAEKLLAVSQAEHTQRKIDSPTWRLIREDGAPMPPNEYAGARALNEQRLVENVRMGILKPDETVTWLNVTAAPLPVPGYGVVITYGDITAQLRAEQALRENNQFVISLLRAIPVAVFFKDWAGHYLGCNDVFSEIMGVSAETIRGKTVYELWPGELAQTYHEKDLELMHNRQHQTYEFQVKDKDGQIRPVIFAKDVFLDASGQPAGMVGAFIDITERKRMEDQLRIKEWAIAGSINAIALADLGGNLTFVNPAFLAMWGYSSEDEVLGKSSIEFWQSRDEADNVMATLQQQGHWRGELLGKCRDGSRFVAEVAASLVLDESGRPLSLLGVFEDITERKQAEAALRESECRYRALFEQANDAIFLEDPDTDRIIDANRRAAELMGYSRERLLAMQVSSLQAPEVRRNVSGVLREEIRQYGNRTFESMNLHADGHRIPVEITNAWLTDLGTALILSIVRDITQRKQAEDALKESEQRYRSLFMAEQRQAQELELLHQARTAIARQVDLSDIFRATVESIGRTFGYTLVSLYLLEGDQEAGTGILTLQHVVGYDQLISQIPISKGVSGRVARTGRPALIQDVRTDPDFLRAIEGIVSEICVPLIDQDRVAGTLNVESRQGLTEVDLRLIVALSEHVSIAIGKARLYEAARGSEKKYRQLSSLLRLMADTMPDMLWAKNLNKEYIFANQAICKNLLNAADTEEPLGKTDMFFAARERAAHPEAPNWHTFGELCRDSDAITLQELKPMQFDEFGNIRGEFLYLEVHKAPLYDDDGQLIGLVGSARDVTARIQIEDALRESEERYRSLFTRTLDGVYRSTHAGKFVDINPAMAKMFGYSSQEEMLGIDIQKELYFDPAERGSHILDTGEQGHETYQMRRKDGSEIWVEDHGYYIHDDQGNITFHEGILRDVTERNRAEEKLRQSETLYRQAIVAAGAVPYRQSYKKRHDYGVRVLFDFIGEGINALTGYAAEEFNDVIWESLVQESHLVEELAAYEWREAIRLVRSGQLPIWKCEHRLRTRDGSTRWVFEAAAELRNQDGISYGSIGMYQDITARKLSEERILQLNAELEQRVQERTAQLEEANKELESFSYSVSHDLRAPLRAIDGFSRILCDEYAGQIPDDGRVLLERIRASASRMGILIDDLLKFSRLGRQTLRTQTIDMTSLVENALATLRSGLEGALPQITLNPLPACQGDPSLLTQVWVNLLSNAIKYSRKRAEARIEIGCYPNETETTVYYIKDNGVGFDMQYASKLFGVFQRLHSESEFEGTGVGLTLVHRIITRHGGRIWAESEPGKGATFYFTLGKGQNPDMTSRQQG